MDRYNTTDPPQRDRALVTAAEWFGGGQRIPYDPESARVLTEEEAVANPGALRQRRRGTLLLRTPLGALGMRQPQGSARVFATAMVQARMYSRAYQPAPEELAELWSAVTRRDGAAFMHNAADFVGEHRRHA